MSKRNPIARPPTFARAPRPRAIFWPAGLLSAAFSRSRCGCNPCRAETTTPAKVSFSVLPRLFQLSWIDCGARAIDDSKNCIILLTEKILRAKRVSCLLMPSYAFSALFAPESIEIKLFKAPLTEESLLSCFCWAAAARSAASAFSTIALAASLPSAANCWSPTRTSMSAASIWSAEFVHTSPTFCICCCKFFNAASASASVKAP